MVDNTDDFECVEEALDNNQNSTLAGPKIIKRNYGISYSQGILHNVYFKFVSYIFCNQITTMSLNVYRNPSNGEKSDGSTFSVKGGLFNSFVMNRSHLKKLRQKFYPNGIKIIDSNFISEFNEIVLAFLHQDDGSRKSEGYVLYCNGFDLQSVNNLVKCYHKLGYSSAHAKTTGRVMSNKQEEYLILINDDSDCIKFQNMYKNSPLITYSMKYKFFKSENKQQIIRNNYECRYYSFHIYRNMTNNYMKYIQKDSYLMYCTICDETVYDCEYHLYNRQCSKCKIFNCSNKEALKHFDTCKGTSNQRLRCLICYLFVSSYQSARHHNEHAKCKGYISLI